MFTLLSHVVVACIIIACVRVTKGDHLMKMRLVSYARSKFMKSEKSKVLGALLPSELCHDEFESLHLQYSYDMAHTFLALCLASRLFLVFEKKNY